MNLKKILKKIKLAESTISTLLGIVVVLVVGVLIYRYFQNTGLKTNQQTFPEEKKEETQPSTNNLVKPENQTYTIQKGENLWTIATKIYGSGYNWVDLANANKITDPNIIFPGMQINLPQANVRLAVKKTPSISVTVKPITENQYQVTKGDSLWKIAVRAYGDGFQWTRIAQANHLVNPSIIHPGNSLLIPR